MVIDEKVNAKKNIAIMVPTLSNGGAERVAGMLARNLSLHYNVFIFLEDTRNIVYDYGRDNGVCIIDIGGDLFVDKKISFYKEALRIDIAISFLEELNFANIRTKGRERVIVSERCAHTPIKSRMLSYEYQVKSLYQWADAIVACSEGVRYELKNIYKVPNDVTVIYNFIDKNMIIEKANEEFDTDIRDFVSSSKYYINIGRLNEQKDQIALIEEFSFYRRAQSSKDKLLIFGNGELLEQQKRIIDVLNEGEFIRVFPYNKNSFRYLKKASGLICTSYYEGLPNVILEAMFLGIPVISVDCLAGPRELLDDNTSYSTPLTDIKIAKRGILIPREWKGKQYLIEAINIINNERKRHDIILCEKAYMEEYVNDYILDKWINVIEGERRNGVYSIDVKNILKKSKKILIYGAGKVGRYCYDLISADYRIDAFLVTDNPKEKTINGIPVIKASKFMGNRDECTVVLGVSYGFQDEIMREVSNMGFDKIVYPVTLM